MKEQILKYEFGKELIEFEVINGNVMANAKQMAKIFAKHVPHFFENENTKKFITACLNSRNSDFISVQNEEDLFISKQKSGTWMHRILALKFAAWLNVDFELWVYATIDKILFDYYKRLEESLKNSAHRKDRMADIEDQLNSIPEFQELQTLKLEERQEAYKRGKENRNQLEMFRESE